jgi:ABC-type nitrate/sulfonate/bicarbonate transport system substrate-binding protein
MKKILGTTFWLIFGLLLVSTVFAADKYPVFTLAWSEYPSWSTFGVLHEAGLINGEEGKYGPIEKKWGVDIVLREMDYDSTIQLYAVGKADAVCITNMDILSPSLSIKSVAILPTSTSFGADALIVSDKIKDINALKKTTVSGLDLSVSRYTFERNLEIRGLKPTEFNFKNLDPATAAMQFQQGQLQAIIVWNPFVLDTLEKRRDSRIFTDAKGKPFDSTMIPGEIIDMVVVSKSSLRKEKGKEFAYAVIESYYELNKMLADPAEGDNTLIALGEKFSNLGLQSMKKVVDQTRFYKTPDKALQLFTGKELKDTMTKVVKFCKKYGIITGEATIEYGTFKNADLTFDPSFIKKIAGK